MTWALFIVGALVMTDPRSAWPGAVAMLAATALHVHAFGWQP